MFDNFILINDLPSCTVRSTKVTILEISEQWNPGPPRMVSFSKQENLSGPD